MHNLLFTLYFFFLTFGAAIFCKANNNNHISSIKTIQLYREHSQMNYPIIRLGTDEVLTLRFDDLQDSLKDFRVTFIHCNSNWETSDLNVNNYIQGFEENDINDYYYSKNTQLKYIHYEYSFPNENITFTASGNYIVKVYTGDLGTEDELVYFTKHFCIVESKIGIKANILQPILFENKRSKQKAQLTLQESTHFKIDYPSKNLKVQVIQNGRNDNMLTLSRPQYIKDGEFVYNLEDNVFDGGNEFQFFDIRSTRFYSNTVHKVKSIEDTINVFLRQTSNRAYKRYFYEWEDINGNYVIKKQETILDDNTEADYVKLHFYYEQTTKNLNPFYVFGRFTNWQTLPEYELKYNTDLFAYQLSILVKQGYYDYQIVEKLPNNNLSTSFTEGNHYQTNNNYMILVFYKGEMDLYERLIGIDYLDSNNLD